MVEDVHYVTTDNVSCDGNGDFDGLGHPRIYLTLGDEGKIVCPYCSRQFIKQGQ